MAVFLTITEYVFCVLAAALLVAFLAYVVAVQRTEIAFRHIPGPSRTSFLLGNLSLLTGSTEKLGIPVALIVGFLMRDRGPLMWIRIFHRPIVFACAPEIVKELLLNSRHLKPQHFYRIFQTLFGVRFLGHGLVSEVNHEKWFHRRAIMNPAFRRKYLMGMMAEFNEASETLCHELLKKADGKTQVDMLDQFNNTTLDVIAKISFSMETEATTNPSCSFPKAVTAALQGMQAMMDKPWADIDPRGEARKLRYSARTAVQLLRKVGEDQIRARIEARRRGDHVPSDILNVILDGAKDLEGDKDFQMVNMLDEFVTLFFAGQETTANLLSFTLQQLGRNPKVAERLQAEVDEVLGDKPMIDYEDLAKLEYMMRVFKETLRLYPPVLGTSRVAAHPITYQGITIPAGTTVTVMSLVMGRSEEFFDDPLLFNPDRFQASEDGSLPKHLFAYFPFSLGQRNCIGQQFAMMEARVILGKLFQRFNFRFNQSQSSTMMSELTVKPMDRCKNYIIPRT